MSDNSDETQLSAEPDYERGRLWDEWFFSFTKAEMQVMFMNDTVHEKFNEWLEARLSTKH